MHPGTAEADCENRLFSRFDVRCRARIRIGKREYAGFVENISEGGVKFVTLTPIRETGPVLVRLPDLPPQWAELRWHEPQSGGVSFCINLDKEILGQWSRTRQYWRAPYRSYLINEALAPRENPLLRANDQ